VLLYAHGNAGNLSFDARMLRYFQTELMVTVLIFDYRGYGKSEGSPTVEGVLQDARAARTALAKKADVKEAEIVLMGRSLGGAVVCQLAGESAPRGLVLENTFSSLKEVAEHHFGIAAAIVPKDRLDSAAQLARYSGPLLQTHGDADKTVPFAMGKKLFDAHKGNKEFVAIAGGQHNDAYTAGYREKLDRFIGSLPLVAQPEALGPGEHARSLQMGDAKRTYLVHVPPKYDPRKPTPVVVVYHGAGTNGFITVLFSGLNTKADEANFIAVYPDGTGVGPFLVWNAGPIKGAVAGLPDDVAFTGKMLDDLAKVLNVDTKRVYATGISNGGMMCYKLAAELPGRFAAIAPIAGTMLIGSLPAKQRPMPIIHFHGTEDTLVPFGGSKKKLANLVVKSVEETVQAWAEIAGCAKEPKIFEVPSKVDDGTKVKRKTFGPGKDGVEVILYEIEGGGHTWPGRPAPAFIGRSTQNISANDLMWEFFAKYQLK
jgi:polyhydroxybutyrate depolymerase